MAKAEITIRLHDAHSLQPMKCKSVDSVEAVFRDMDTGTELKADVTPKDPKGPEDPSIYEAEVTLPPHVANAMVGATVKVIQKSGGSSSCQQIATLVEDRSKCAIDCLVPPVVTTEKIAHYKFKPRWCKDGVRGDEAEISQAWAERISITTPGGLRAGDNRVFHAVVQEGTASFAVPADATYEFHFETKKKKCSNPAFTLHVCCEGNFEHQPCLVGCEGTRTFHISDTCGKPSPNAGVVVEAPGAQVDASQPGKVIVTGVEEGQTITLHSQTHDLSPDQYRVGEARNQNVDVVARAKAHAHVGSDREEIVVNIDEEIKAGEDVLVKFLDADNVLVKTLKAESGKPVSYHAPRGKPLKIQLLVNGEITDEANYMS